MSDTISFLIILAAWFVLLKFILPKFGVPT